MTCYLIGLPVDGDKMQVRLTVHNDPPPRLLSVLVEFHRTRYHESVRLYEMRVCYTCASGAGDLREVTIEPDTDLN